MSYQVLARKWRPRAFTEMVGQEHVLRALINGLDNDRLHHAYLFTGTRGVGKTTLARILAKCLNCETGVSSEPCNQCSACREIAEGRFVDLIEVDAASRTKVEDTRELLDNVQYAPTRGRYKVYLIDEVHMLSTHSFNALLKTLEEPPPHVKFLLATTDPQKLPVTILSRCLQFNLKNLGPERIVGHLKHILSEEKIPFEEPALWQLSRAADGSMRDALSLTDQAIAHGGGTLTAAEVNAMLGTIDRSSVVEICQAIAEGSAEKAMARVAHMADHAPDYPAALGDMLSIWHQVAIAQSIPDALDPVQEHHSEILALANQVSREDIQLFYQITLLGRKDLPFAADARSGFEMVLLRLLAFRPVTPEQNEQPSSAPGPAAKNLSGTGGGEGTPLAKKPEAGRSPIGLSSPAGSELTGEKSLDSRDPFPRQGAAVATVMESLNAESGTLSEKVPAGPPESNGKKKSNVTPIRPEVSLVARATVSGIQSEPNIAVVSDEVEADVLKAYESYSSSSSPDEKPLEPAVDKARETGEATSRMGIEADKLAMVGAGQRIPLADFCPANWKTVCDGLGQGGLLQNTAMNLVLEKVENHQVYFQLDQGNSALYDESQSLRLSQVLSEYFGCKVDVSIGIGAIRQESPRMIAERLRAERLQEAIDSLKTDPNVQELMRVFGAELVESSVKPID